MKIKLLSLILIPILTSVSCVYDPMDTDLIPAGPYGVGSEDAPWEEGYFESLYLDGDLYTDNIYPNETLIYDIGSDTFAFADGYIETLYTWNGTAWQSVIGGGGGDVVGPASATDHGLVRYDGVTGKLIQDSLGTLLDDSANLFLGGDLSATDADIGGDLDVTGTSTFRDIVYFAGPYSRYYDDIEASYGNSSDYWSVYNPGATQFEFWTSDSDGIGTDGVIYSVDDGTDGLNINGTVNMTSHQIINVTDPTNNQDAATKFYVDNNAYGGLYEDSAGSDITITTAGTYYRWITSTAGIDNLTTASAAGDNITINAGGDGAYRVTAHLSASSDHNDRLIHMAVFLNGVKLDQASCEVFIKFAAEEHSIGSGGLVALVEDDVLDLRITGDHNGEVITVKHAGISVNRIAR